MKRNARYFEAEVGHKLLWYKRLLAVRLTPDEMIGCQRRFALLKSARNRWCVEDTQYWWHQRTKRRN